MVLPLGGRVGRCQLNTKHTIKASSGNPGGAFVCLDQNKEKTHGRASLPPTMHNPTNRGSGSILHSRGRPR